MLSNRSIGLRSLETLLLLVGATLSFWIWLFIWEDVGSFDQGILDKYLLYNEFLLIGIVLGLSRKQHSPGSFNDLGDALRRSGRQALIGLFAVLALVFLLKDTLVSRSFLLSYAPWLCLTLLFFNYIAPKWLSRWAFSESRRERVALAGTLEQAGRIRAWLERKRSVGLESVGVVCPQPMMETKLNGYETPYPVLGHLDEMEKILKGQSITQVIVLDLAIGREQLLKLTQLCEGNAVRLLALDSLDNPFTHATTSYEDDGIRVIGLREEPLESPISRFIKRTMDLAIALPIVIFIFPLLHALVWLLQCQQSPGPLLFRQERIGMKGQSFKMYKYRTMHVNHGDEARQASKDDQRIYPAGRWLRRLSIDEFPQFVNVLKGEMSVVGPRPHLSKHEEMWSAAMRKYVIRRFIRPGITGYAQVKGYRGEVHSLTDVQNRVEMDIYYLEHWSFSLDVAIILKTLKQCVLPPRSAY